MLKNLIVILSLFILSACNDEDERFKDCKDLTQLLRYGEVEDEVIFQLTDMQYACGECLSLYRVDKILYSELNQYKFYLNKELSLLFLNENLKNQSNDFVCKNENQRQVYIFVGQYRRNDLGSGRLDVIGGSITCIDNNE